MPDETASGERGSGKEGAILRTLPRGTHVELCEGNPELRALKEGEVLSVAAVHRLHELYMIIHRVEPFAARWCQEEGRKT